MSLQIKSGAAHLNRFSEWDLDPKAKELVECCRLYQFAKGLTSFRIDTNLVAQLVNAYNPTTGCFHLGKYELYMGLQDILFLTALPIDGKAVIASSIGFRNLCENLLGKSPGFLRNKRKNSGDASEKNPGVFLSLNLLKKEFKQDLSNIEDRVVIERHARAYLLYLIGSVVIPSLKSDDVCGIFLGCLGDVCCSDDYAWGSALLAHLHDTMKNVKESGRVIKNFPSCSYIIQMFALERLPELAGHCSISLPNSIPLAHEWSKVLVKPGRDNLKKFDLTKLLEQDSFKVEWQPYHRLEDLPMHIRQQLELCKCQVHLICNERIWYHKCTNAKLQLGVQLKALSKLNDPRHESLKLREMDWPEHYAPFVEAWDKRWSFCEAEEQISEQGVVTSVDENEKYESAKKEAVEPLRYVEKEASVSEESVEEVVVLEESPQKFDDMIGEMDHQPSTSSVLTKRNLEVEESPDELLKSLHLDGYKTTDPRVCMKLWHLSKRRSGRLDALKFQIQLNENEQGLQQLMGPQKKEKVFEEDVASEVFKPLTEEEELEVASALSDSNRMKDLVTHESSNIVITGEILQCLKPGEWLNDEVINLYFELLKEREKREPQKFLNCHFFNTFFYKKLISGRGEYDYQSVRRWTSQRKLGYCIYDCDKIFVPIPKEVHWCLAVINKKETKIQYLDSLGGGDSHVMTALTRYIVDEVKDKKGKDLDLSSWQQEFVEDLPEQQNGFDCGVFMIKYADFCSRDVGLGFSQDQIPYLRKRTAKEILLLKAE